MDLSPHLLEYVLDAASSDAVDIHLLRDMNVLKWIIGDCGFLKATAAAAPSRSPSPAPAFGKKARRPSKTSERARLKQLEDLWGRSVMKARRPDLAMKKDWTNLFCEYICRELYTLLGETVSKPPIKRRLHPDLQTDDVVIEVKGGTYFTTGTAHEKVIAVPFKYARVPKLYGKPLRVICVAGAEKRCREEYGNLGGPECYEERQFLLDCYRKLRIEFVAATDLVRAVARLRVGVIAVGVVADIVATAVSRVAAAEADSGLEAAFTGLTVSAASASSRPVVACC